MQNYKDLNVWVWAHEFVLEVYAVSKKFPKEELFALTNQLKRSAISIPANIAEGCGKKSNNELAHFLNISLGSANETEYLLILAKDLSFINDQEASRLLTKVNKIKGMLITFITKVRQHSVKKPNTYNLLLKP